MKKTFQELYDEKLILGEGGNICDISIHKLRSPTMKKLHKASCPIEKDTAMRRAGKKAGMSRTERKKLYNSLNEAESRKDALRRALAISKWKKAGGKVDKMPMGRAGGLYKGKGVKQFDDDEEDAINRAIAAYRKLKKSKSGSPRTRSWLSKEDIGEGLKDLPPHLQKLVKKIEKKQREWKKLGLKTKTFVYNPETGKPDLEVKESILDDNMVELIKKEMDSMLRAAKKGDYKTLMGLYKALGRIIK